VAPAGSGDDPSRLRQALFSFRFGRVAVGIWVLATLAFLAASLPLFAALAQPGTSSSDVITEDFNAGRIVRPDRLVSVVGFKSGDQGWYLDSGTSGRLVYRIPGATRGAIGLTLWLNVPSGVTDTVIARAQGQPDAVLSTNASLVGDWLSLPSAIATAASAEIDIQARNESGGQVLVIDQLLTSVRTGADPLAPPFYSYLAFGGLAALVTLGLLRGGRHAAAVASAMGVVVATATFARLTVLIAARGPLDPDAVAYRMYADRFQWWPLFDNGLFSGNFSEREPLFPMVVHIYFQVLGSSDFHIRVVSTTLSIAVVIVSVIAARRRLSWWPALAVGFLVAVSPPLVRESVRGLRLELEMLMLLLLYIALDRGPAKRPLLDAVLVGVLGAAMVLTRTYYFPVFGAAVAISFLARYRPLRRAIALAMLAAILMVSAETAHRVGLYVHTHDVFSDTAGYNRWNANLEYFIYHRPLAHRELFPSLADYQKFGLYFGPKISTVQYLFEIHSPQEFVRDSLAGSREIFDTVGVVVVRTRLGPLAPLGNRVDLVVQWLVLLGLMGMLLRAWRHPRLAIIPAIVLTWLAMTGFLYDHGLLERYRHTWQTFPLALIAAAWLVESSMRMVMRRFYLNRAYARWYHLAISNLDLAPFPIAVGLALVQARLSPRLLFADDVFLAIAIGLLAYRRPAVGTIALLLVVSVASPQSAAAAAAVALVAVLGRERPAVRSLMPIIVVAPIALAISIAAGRLSSAALLLAATMVCVVATAAVVARRPAGRMQLIWGLAAIGPLAGIAFVLGPATVPPAAALAPVGVLAATWLYQRGERWALALGLVSLAIVILVEPFFAWLGVVVALAWLVIRSRRFVGARPRIAAAGAAVVGLALLAGGASLSATSPTPDVGWQTQLANTNSSIRQQITVDRAGDDAVWIYGSRSSVFSDYPVRVFVNGVAITDDLNSYLPTGGLAWVAVPLGSTLHEGDQVDVQLIPTGNPNPVDRYVDVGGVYSRVPGLSSPSTRTGTYLIVLGDDSLPLAPGGLPEPMVHGRWQLPMGEGLPGELGAPVTAREQTETGQIWGAALQITARNPLGLGLSGLGTALSQRDGSIAPDLSARDEYLQAASEWGWAGLAGLLILLVGAAWFARRSGDNLAVALLLLTAVSMAGESLLLDPAGAAATWMVVGLCLTAGAASRSTSRA
jgi:hypothetical protein